MVAPPANHLETSLTPRSVAALSYLSELPALPIAHAVFSLAWQFSRVPFDHYNIPTGSEILNRELPRGKRIQCDGQQRDQRMSSIFD